MSEFKNMTDMELNEELDRASEHLAKTESAYVQAQNLCTAIEDELARRDSRRVRSVPQVELQSLVDRWSTKAVDIQRAADVFKDDPRSQHSLTVQRDLLQACIADLYRILGR